MVSWYNHARAHHRKAGFSKENLGLNLVWTREASDSAHLAVGRLHMAMKYEWLMERLHKVAWELLHYAVGAEVGPQHCYKKILASSSRYPRSQSEKCQALPTISSRFNRSVSGIFPKSISSLPFHAFMNPRKI